MVSMAEKRTAAGLPSLDLDPFNVEFLSDPYAFHSSLRDAGPVVWLEAYGIYGMARYAQVSEALKDWQTFCSARGVGLTDFAKEENWRPPSLLLEADPPLHSRTRSLMNKIVSLSALRVLRPEWQAKAEELIDRLVRRRRIDAVTELAEQYPLLVFPDTIGLPEDGRELLLTYGAVNFNALGPKNAIFHESFAAASPKAIDWVAAGCRRENLKPGGWGMAVYEAADRGDCTPEEAERLVRSFLSAGLDTTINGIGNMMFALATHPQQWQILRDDPTMARKAVEESLRWDSTAQTFFRTTTRDVDIDGITIPEGSKVLLFLAAANRDSRHWGEDAEEFSIRRQVSGHVGFGFGIHQCLGQMLVRQEAVLVLEALISRVAEISLTGEPERRLNNTLHALAKLPVELLPAM
jgi:4-methoxybenzoate monooxygenase (O-demethylating)